jgi:hypothetical protein
MLWFVKIALIHCLQAYWSDTLQKLPTAQNNHSLVFLEWLRDLFAWLSSSFVPASTQLAIKVVRCSDSPFGGVGVYTSVELFFMAGKCTAS